MFILEKERSKVKHLSCHLNTPGIKDMITSNVNKYTRERKIKKTRLKTIKEKMKKNRKISKTKDWFLEMHQKTDKQVHIGQDREREYIHY